MLGLGKIRVGVSSCLLGERVRHDGGHKYHSFINRELGRHFDWVPVCPEVELGLGTPRDPIQLARGDDGRTRLVSVRGRRDLTDEMAAFAGRKLRELEELGLHGFLFKAGSPSCGPAGVPIHGQGGVAAGEGRGLFARHFAARLPWIPAASEDVLEDVSGRLHFVERVHAHALLEELTREPGDPGSLPTFHGRHEEFLRRHDPASCAALGELVRTDPGEDRVRRYGRRFLETLTRRPPRQQLEDAVRALLSEDPELLRVLLEGHSA